MSIYLYTGEGAGKTTNALGLALRSLGHKHKVVIIQFLKWWKNTGEYKFQKFNKNYKVYQFGRRGWKGFKNLTKEDKKLAEKALNFSLEITKKARPDLLILDEINLAAYLKLIDEKEIINTLKKIKKSNKKIDIVLTGRHAPQKLIDFSDAANKISVIKLPKRIITTKGINY